MRSGSRTASLLLLASAAAAIGAAGFVLGTRWPVERITTLFGSGADGHPSPWTLLATTDLPRYENLTIDHGDHIFLLGGFSGLDPEGNALATDRVETLDLRSGAFESRTPMPEPLTHGGGARVGDSIWVVGGFVGDHPGPATDVVRIYTISTDSWGTGPPLPAPRAGGALVPMGDTLHYFAGFLPDRNTDSRDHWSLVIGDSTWRPVDDFPLPRGHLTRIPLADRFLAVGGNIGHDPLPVDVPAVHAFDPSLRVWTSGADLPFAVSHTEPATVPYEGGAVMVGGRSRTTGRENIDDVLFYDPRLDRWVHLGRLPIPFLGGTAGIFADSLVAGLGAEVGNDARNARLWKRPLRNRWLLLDSLPGFGGGRSGTALDGILYLVGEGTLRTSSYSIAAGTWSSPGAVDVRPWGGSAALEAFDGRILSIGGPGRGAGRVQVFDPALGQWRLGPELPPALESPATAQVGGRIYAVGGLVGGVPVADVLSMAAGDSAWTAHSPLPRLRSHAAAGSDGRRLFVFGGRDETGQVTADVQIFDPAQGAWSKGVSMPDPRAEQGRAVFTGGEFWLIGGASPDGVGRGVHLFDPVAGTWRSGPPMVQARSGAAVVLDGDRIFVAGGRGGSGEPTRSFEYVWPKR